MKQLGAVAGPARGLTGRDLELRVLTGLVERLAAGEPARVDVVGPPGMGRTALVQRVVSLAKAEDLRAGLARCSPFESDVPYGVVGQLLATLHSPGRMAELAAACVAGTCASPVVLLCDAFTDLARSAPLVLAVDDLQWADTWSLRWFDAMSRRAHRAPVLLVGTAHGRLARHLGHDPVLDEGYPVPAHEIVLGPLGEEDVGELLESAFGASVGEVFVRAARDASRGHPAILQATADKFLGLGLRPDAEQARRFATLAHAVWSGRITHLIRGLPVDAVELLRAIAVCGPALDSELAGALVRLRHETLERALEHLEVAGLVTGGQPIRLTDPLVGTEVLAGMDVAEREALYLRAAVLGHRSGIGANAVAELLCSAPAAGRSWAGEALIESAALRARQGRTADAAEVLRRALAEPMETRERAELLTRLAAIEVLHAPEASDGRLRQVLVSHGEPESWPSVIVAADLLLGRGDAETARRAVSELCERAKETMPAPAITALSALGWLAQEEASAEPEIPVAPLPAPDLTATGPADAGVLSWRLATRAQEPDRVRELAEMALAGRGDPPLMPRLAACRALLCCYDLDPAVTGLDALLADARRHNSRAIAAQALLYRSVAALRAGRTEESIRDLGGATRELPLRCWHPALVPRYLAGEALGYLRLGRLDEAERAATVELPRGAELGVGWAFLLYARAELRLVAGDSAGALAPLQECGRILRARDWVNPMLVPWRSMAGIALDRLGRHDAAAELFAQERSLALEWGTEAQLDELRENVAACVGAIVPLWDKGSPGARRAAKESTVDVSALSEGERDVAALAARGLINREIAEALSLAVRTVELRLTKIYRKLGLTGRADLAGKWPQAAED